MSTQTVVFNRRVQPILRRRYTLLDRRGEEWLSYTLLPNRSSHRSRKYETLPLQTLITDPPAPSYDSRYWPAFTSRHDAAQNLWLFRKLGHQIVREVLT